MFTILEFDLSPMCIQKVILAILRASGIMNTVFACCFCDFDFLSFLRKWSICSQHSGLLFDYIFKLCQLVKETYVFMV